MFGCLIEQFVPKSNGFSVTEKENLKLFCLCCYSLHGSLFTCIIIVMNIDVL